MSKLVRPFGFEYWAEYTGLDTTNGHVSHYIALAVRQTGTGISDIWQYLKY